MKNSLLLHEYIMYIGLDQQFGSKAGRNNKDQLQVQSGKDKIQELEEQNADMTNGLTIELGWKSVRQ